MPYKTKQINRHIKNFVAIFISKYDKLSIIGKILAQLLKLIQKKYVIEFEIIIHIYL